MLFKALEEITLEKQYQEKCLLMLVHALQSYTEYMKEGKLNSDSERVDLCAKYKLMLSSVLMASLPRHFPGRFMFLQEGGKNKIEKVIYALI